MEAALNREIQYHENSQIGVLSYDQIPQLEKRFLLNTKIRQVLLKFDYIGVLVVLLVLPNKLLQFPRPESRLCISDLRGLSVAAGIMCIVHQTVPDMLMCTSRTLALLPCLGNDKKILPYCTTYAHKVSFLLSRKERHK